MFRLIYVAKCLTDKHNKVTCFRIKARALDLELYAQATEPTHLPYHLYSHCMGQRKHKWKYLPELLFQFKKCIVWQNKWLHRIITPAKRSVLTLVTNKFCLEERKGPSIVNWFELNFRTEINSTYFNKRADLAIGNLFILAFLRNMVSTQQAFTLLYKGLVSMLDEIVP